MSFVQLSKISLAISVVLVLGSIVLLLGVGPRLSIEFTGGTLMEVRLPDGKTEADLRTAVQEYEQKTDLGNVTFAAINGVSGRSYLMRMRPVTNEEHVALLKNLETKFKDIKELQFNTIGPSVSANLKQKSLLALGVASVAIILYLAFAFRKLPRKLNPWKFGVLAVVAFIHDVLITAGVFVIISHVTSFEFDTLFVTALLTILAYSANETIIVLDRIRANLTLMESKHDDFVNVVALSLRQCIGRTCGTTVSVLIMLITLFIMGAEAIHWFILALIFGAFMGIYSSYLVAAPLLIVWRNKNDRR